MQRKKIHLEIIRIIALICIIYNHTGDRGCSLYAYTDGRITFTVSLLSDIICKIGVPLFFMITGAVLLGKQEDIQALCKKRWIRIGGVIVLFTMIRYVYECFLLEREEFSIIRLIQAILKGNLFVPYWFLYTYFSVLLILPFLRILALYMKQIDYCYFILLLCIFKIALPIYTAISQQEIAVSFMLEEICSYMIMGYYIENILPKQFFNRKWFLILVGIGISSVFITYRLLLEKYFNPAYMGNANSSMLVIPLACTIFYCIKYMFLKGVKVPEKVYQYIIKMGECVFGIYLIEDYLRNGLAFIWDITAKYISALPACGIWIFSILIVGFPFI